MARQAFTLWGGHEKSLERRMVHGLYRNDSDWYGTSLSISNTTAHEYMGFYYVYILRSKKDLQLYTGFTNNIERRLTEHHQGKAHSTKHRRPLELIYYEAHKLKQTAMRREKYLKTTKGKTYIKIVLREVLDK